MNFMDYYLYLDELSTFNNRNEWRLKSCLDLVGEGSIEGEDIQSELKKPVECISWCVWSYFLISDEITKRLHVCGSEFGQTFFEAIARYLNVTRKPSFCCLSGDDNGATRRLLNISLKERLERFSVLCRKYKFDDIVHVSVNVIGNIDIDSHIQSVSESLLGQNICSVHFGSNKGKADLTFVIADSYDVAVEKLCTERDKFLFVVNPAFETDNVLTPDPVKSSARIWMFNNYDSLKNVLRAYVESAVIAPALVNLCHKFLKYKFLEMSLEHQVELLTLSRRYPFSYALIPDSAMVETPVRLDMGHIGIVEKPILSVISACNKKIGEFQKDGSVCFVPEEIGEFHVEWNSRTSNECIIISESGCADGTSASIFVRNHCQTTKMDVVPVGEAYGERLRIPLGRAVVFNVVARNKYDSSLVPNDAKNWKWELKGDGASVLQDDMSLRFMSRQTGSWTMRVFWPRDNTNVSPKIEALVPWNPERDNLSKTLKIDVVGRADKVCVKILPVVGRPTFSSEVKYTDEKIYFECYPGEVFALSAWLEGEKELWNRHVKVEGLGDIEPWDDKNHVIERGFRSIGIKKFSVMSADDTENLVRYIEVNVKTNYSELVRKWMIGCFAVSSIVFLCSYGLNWFNFLVYMMPVGIGVIHFKYRFHKYRRLMGLLCAIDIFFVLWAFCQEVF